MTCAQAMFSIAYFFADAYGWWIAAAVFAPFVAGLGVAGYYECKYHYGLAHDRQLNGLRRRD